MSGLLGGHGRKSQHGTHSHSPFSSTNLEPLPSHDMEGAAVPGGTLSSWPGGPKTPPGTVSLQTSDREGQGGRRRAWVQSLLRLLCDPRAGTALLNLISHLRRGDEAEDQMSWFCNRNGLCDTLPCPAPDAQKQVHSLRTQGPENKRCARVLRD